MKILLTEGSSTSARQTLYALGRAGHTLDICDPQRLCLGRFSNYVRRWHRCPSFTAEPRAYLEFLLERLQAERYDMLFPVHDQVYLLARFQDAFHPLTGLALPSFDALNRLQNKASFARLMEELNLPHPPTRVLSGIEELRTIREFPCYVKLAISTAGCGVWRADDRDSLNDIASKIESLAAQGPLPELLVQQPVSGTFLAVQAVFMHGQLAGAHAYRGRATGVGGSAHARESRPSPELFADVSRLGAHLGWHGALHMECFHDEPTGRRWYIEANPRIGETFNATLSGTNLCDLLARVSIGEAIATTGAPRAGVLTHSLMMSLMGAAERGHGRLSLATELARCLLRRGVYAGSQDELTRPWEDPLSVIPLTAVVLQLFFRPAIARGIIRRAVDNYSLNTAAMRRLEAVTELKSTASFNAQPEAPAFAAEKPAPPDGR